MEAKALIGGSSRDGLVQQHQLPHEQRNIVVIGNLGAKADFATIEGRVKALMTQAGIEESWYEDTQAVSRTSNICLSWFFDPRNIQRPCLKLQSRRLVALGGTAPVWLDYNKTDEERKPNRLLAKMSRLRIELENNLTENRAIVSDKGAKNIYNVDIENENKNVRDLSRDDKDEICYYSKGQFIFRQYAYDRYGQEAC